MTRARGSLGTRLIDSPSPLLRRANHNAPARAEQSVQVSACSSFGRFSLRVIVQRVATVGSGTVASAEAKFSVDISPRLRNPLPPSLRACAGRYASSPSLVDTFGGCFGASILSRAYVCARNFTRVRGCFSCVCVCGFENLKSDVRECNV